MSVNIQQSGEKCSDFQLSGMWLFQGVISSSTADEPQQHFPPPCPSLHPRRARASTLGTPYGDSRWLWLVCSHTDWQHLQPWSCIHLTDREIVFQLTGGKDQKCFLNKKTTHFHNRVQSICNFLNCWIMCIFKTFNETQEIHLPIPTLGGIG